jgi:flagellin-like protein
MFETINKADEERGQVGIGTLIVFIALVLVAAIAAGVLINTAGFLQNQAESTGQESSDQVTQAVQAQGAIGTSNGSAIQFVEIDVSLAPGADPINVNKSTIQYVAPDGAATLRPGAGVDTADPNTAGDEVFEVTGSNTLEEESDQTTINVTLSPNSGAMSNLEPGEEATFEITTKSGGQSTVVVNVPEPLTAAADEDIRL